MVHDPLTRLIAQIVVIIVVSRVLGLGTRRLGQPLVVAEMIAGILLGPSLLGWAAPGVSNALFAPGSLDLLRLISQLGLVFFMFLVGLELDPRLLRGRGRTSVAISQSGIVVPFVLGIALAAWMYPRFAEPGVSRLAFVLFMGVAMSITAFPVLARILTERRLLHTEVGAMTIACAAIDDVTAWCVLAFVVAAARSSDLESAVVTVALTAGFIVVMVGLVRPLLARISARAASPDAITQNLVAIVLVAVLVASWSTEQIGIHALFGAFLFGAILPREGGFARALANRLEDLVVVVFLPLFFASSGLRTEIGLLSEQHDWGVFGLVMLVACAGKFGGAFVPARLAGLGWREATAIGVLMNTRGLMELIVLNIGLELGVISPTVFSMMVLMALATTFATTPLVMWIYPQTPTVERRPAAQHVLACVAHPGAGPGLVSVAHWLAGETAQVRLLHLARNPERSSAQLGETPADPLAPARRRASELAVQIEETSYVSADPGDDIVRIATAAHFDLVLLGGHKPVLRRTLLGGVVHDVLRGAPATVAVLVDRGVDDVRRVLAPPGTTSHELAQRIAGAAGVPLVEATIETAQPHDLVVIGVAHERAARDTDASVLLIRWSR